MTPAGQLWPLAGVPLGHCTSLESTLAKSSLLLNPLFPLVVASLRGWSASESPDSFRRSALATTLPADPNIVG